MTLLEGKALKAATREGGQLGRPLRSGGGPGILVHHIGDDWEWRPGQSINMLVDYQNHIGLQVKFSTVKFQMVVTRKRDVEHWGVLDRRSVPMAQAHDRSSTIAFGLLYGPIGALLGASMDARAEEKRGGKPVIGVAYRAQGEEHAFFLEYALAPLYHRAHDFLSACLPGLLRQ
jgi:hypothetical protein